MLKCLIIPTSGIMTYYRDRYLRPYLEACIAQGKAIPVRYRSWWFYMPQIHARVMNYQVPPYAGTVHLTGRLDWLTAHTPSWTILLESGGLVEVPLPLAVDHMEVAELPAAKPWIDLVRGWS